MNDLRYLPPASSPPPEPSHHSRLGIASLVLSFISLIPICLFFLFVNWFFKGTKDITTLALVFIGGVVLLVLSELVGIGSGIVALVNPTRSKVFGILGITINGVILLSLCILGVLALSLFIFLFSGIFGGQG